MRLIGMLDSPYVRRVAVSLNLLDLPFAHESLSVFRQYEAFASINPVVKAPTLVLDDGTVLMESTLILDHIGRLASNLALDPVELRAHARSQRIVGLALAAAEKSVQIYYEHIVRPGEKLHQPWLDRVTHQLFEAYRLLEAEIGEAEGWVVDNRPMQADITTATAYTFTVRTIPEVMKADAFPAIARLTARAEAHPAFQASPYDG